MICSSSLSDTSLLHHNTKSIFDLIYVVPEEHIMTKSEDDLKMLLLFRMGRSNMNAANILAMVTKDVI